MALCITKWQLTFSASHHIQAIKGMDQERNAPHQPGLFPLQYTLSFKLIAQFWPRWVFLTVRAFSPVAAASPVVEHGLQGARLRCCDPRPQQVCPLVSRAPAQQLCRRCLAAPWHMGPSWIRKQTHVSCTGVGILTTEPPGKPNLFFNM